MKSLGRWQLLGTGAMGLLAFALAGVHGGISALLGSLSVWIGSTLAWLSMQRPKDNKNAGAALLILLRAEAIKIVVIALLLLLTFKVYRPGLVPLALIGGLAVSALLSGIAIGRIGEEEKE